MISYTYTHPGTEVSRIQSHPLENMICLTASKLTSLQSLSSTSLCWIHWWMASLEEVLVPNFRWKSNVFSRSSTTPSQYSPLLSSPIKAQGQGGASIGRCSSHREKLFHVFLASKSTRSCGVCKRGQGSNYFDYVISITSWASTRSIV